VLKAERIPEQWCIQVKVEGGANLDRSVLECNTDPPACAADGGISDEKLIIYREWPNPVTMQKGAV
jgi:hypothetical protein